MENVRELTPAETMSVSGGGENSATEDVGHNRKNKSSKTGPQNTLGRNAPNYIYSDPSTVKCANDVYGGMIGGAIKGGISGMVKGVVGGAITGQCLSGGGNNGGNGNAAGSSQCSGNSAAGSCNR